MGFGVGEVDRFPLVRMVLVGPSAGAEITTSTALRFLGGPGGLPRADVVVSSLGPGADGFCAVVVLELPACTGTLSAVALPVSSTPVGAVPRSVAESDVLGAAIAGLRISAVPVALEVVVGVAAARVARWGLVVRSCWSSF